MEKRVGAGGGTAAEDNSSQSLGSWCLWVTKSVPRALLGRELTHLLLFTHILRTRSFCYCRPPPPPPHWVPQVVEGHLCPSSGEHPGSIWEHRAESELQSDSTRLRRTWRPLQASRVARTVLQQAGTAGGGPPLPIQTRLPWRPRAFQPDLPPSAPPFRPCPLPRLGPAPVTPGGWRRVPGLRAALARGTGESHSAETAASFPRSPGRWA